MLVIKERYLETEEIRNNLATRHEVLVGIIIDKYIHKGDRFIVGENTDLNLPDVFNENKNIGYEVVWVERQDEYLHSDVTRQLSKIKYDYDKYLQMKEQGDSVFNSIKLDITTSDGIIVTTSAGAVFESAENWMRQEYRSELEKKFQKLNKGLYSDCTNISLAVLTINSDFPGLNEKVLYGEYVKLCKQYRQKFDTIYLISMDNIFCITETKIQKIKNYSSKEYEICVVEMRKRLA